MNTLYVTSTEIPLPTRGGDVEDFQGKAIDT